MYMLYTCTQVDISGICLFLRFWVSYKYSGKMTTLELLGEAADCNCSGKRHPRSMNSHAKIFCANFGGIAGHPGNAVKACSLFPSTARESRGAVELMVLVADAATEWAMLRCGVEVEGLKVGRPKARIAGIGGVV